MVPSTPTAVAILWPEAGLDFNWSCSDIYLSDQKSWLAIRNLANLLLKDETSLLCGISIGCFVRIADKYSFAWKMNLSKSENEMCTYDSAGCNMDALYWYVLPQKLRRVVGSFADCESMHVSICNSILAPAGNNAEWILPSFLSIEVYLIMNSASHVYFYGSLCPSLHFTDIRNKWIQGKIMDSMCTVFEHFFSVYHGCNVVDILSVKQFQHSSQGCVDSEACIKCVFLSLRSLKEISEVDISETSVEKIEVSVDGDIQELCHTSLSERRGKCSKATAYQKLVDTAASFAELYPDRVFGDDTCPAILGKMRTPVIIIECPACQNPRKAATSSAFLNLLRHLTKRHPQSTESLVGEIEIRYAPYIKFIQQKVAVAHQRIYRRKLRKNRNVDWLSYCHVKL